MTASVRRAGPHDLPSLAALRRAWSQEQAGGALADPDFEAAFERAAASGKPTVLELPVDPERISPRVKLSDLQAGT